MLTVVDQWSRQSPLLEVATAMSRRTVARYGATDGVVDAIGRRSGRIPPLWVLCSDRRPRRARGAGLGGPKVEGAAARRDLRTGELLDSTVGAVGDEDVPATIHRDAIGGAELSVPAAGGPPRAEEGPGVRELLDAVVDLFGDEDIPTSPPTFRNGSDAFGVFRM